MSEEITHRFPNDGFTLILTRLDSIDTRLGSVETRLDSMDTRFDSMDTRFDSIDTRFDSMDTRLDSMDTRLDSMDSRLTGVEIRLTSVDIRLTELDERVDRRLMETRPIWDQVLGRIDILETNVSGLREEMADRFDLLNEKFGAFNEDMLNLRAGHRRLDKRLEKIESERPQ